MFRAQVPRSVGLGVQSLILPFQRGHWGQAEGRRYRTGSLSLWGEGEPLRGKTMTGESAVVVRHGHCGEMVTVRGDQLLQGRRAPGRGRRERGAEAMGGERRPH